MMEWREGNPLFVGVRTYTLHTRAGWPLHAVRDDEVFSGPTPPMIAGRLPTSP